MNSSIFYLGVTLLLVHEIDAIRCKEWRIIPGLSSLKERAAMITFMLLHIPLFYWIIYEINAEQQNFRTGFDIFLIIHLILHILFLWHKNNEFKDWISWTIIIGAGICGILDLWIS